MLLMQHSSTSYFALKNILPGWSLALALEAISLHLVLRWLVSQPRPLAKMRRVVWWLKPLWQLQIYLGLLSATLLFLIAGLQTGEP